MAKVKLPYGIDLFEQVRSRNCYYIDKTGFIRELLSEEFTVNLITRPRRFGKTLTMSMLAEFFDIRKDSKAIFEGLEITKDTALCAEWMNQWPVLFLTLKDVDGDCFEDAYDLLQFVISSLCGEHAYLLASNSVLDSDKKIFHQLLEQSGQPADVKAALIILLRMMKAHYGKDVILLIDEYDVPLAKASDNGYYKQMLNVIKRLLGMSWKSNPALKFAVVTGCLRIAKESIFTGANNFISNSISSKKYQDYFGFKETEENALLQAAELPDALPEMKRWYDGYLFGGQEVYCPWDVLSHVRALMTDPKARPGYYWLDTSHNNIIRRFIGHPQINVNEKFETLLAGGVIQEPIREDLTYDIANSTESNLWSILYLAGYLTQEITDILFDTISYFDYKEDYYHAFVTDMFVAAGYGVKSNYEQGTGRVDIIVKDQRRRRALVIEAKWLRKKEEYSSLEKECADALDQIEREQYAKNLQLEGYKAVLCYGAAFQGKMCLIKMAE